MLISYESIVLHPEAEQAHPSIPAYAEYELARAKELLQSDDAATHSCLQTLEDSPVHEREFDYVQSYVEPDVHLAEPSCLCQNTVGK